MSVAFQNLALGCRAWQSSISRWSKGTSVDSDAMNATNGDLTKDFGFHTDQEENPWWVVDLGKQHSIAEIHIYNRKESVKIQSRLYPFFVEVSSDGNCWNRFCEVVTGLIFSDSHHQLDPVICSVATPVDCRYVRIFAPGKARFLHLTEVEVYAASLGSDDRRESIPAPLYSILTRLETFATIDSEDAINHLRVLGTQSVHVWKNLKNKDFLIALWKMTVTICEEGRNLRAMGVISDIYARLMGDGAWRAWMNVGELRYLLNIEARRATPALLSALGEFIRRDPSLRWDSLITVVNRKERSGSREILKGIDAFNDDFYAQLAAGYFLYAIGHSIEASDVFSQYNSARLPGLIRDIANESHASARILREIKTNFSYHFKKSEVIEKSRSCNPPFIVIHNGDQDYMYACLYSLAVQNGPRNVIFLTNNSEEGPFGVRTYRISDYFEGASKFKDIYFHCATTEYSYELLCFQRWMIVEEFVRRSNIDQFILVDSDVLAFSSSNEMLDALPIQYHMNDWAWTCVVRNSRIISDFTEMLHSTYSKPKDDVIEFIQTRGRKLPDGRYSMQDMHALHAFGAAEERKDRIANFYSKKDLFGFDQNMIVDNGFVMEEYSPASALMIHNKKVKKVVWRDRKPHVIDGSNGDTVRFHTLHYQGHTKILMGQHLADAYDSLSAVRSGKKQAWSGDQEVSRSGTQNDAPAKNERLPRKIFLDCGAHRGTSIEKFAKAYPKHEFFCFEPNLELVGDLMKVASQCGVPVFCIPAAVWTHDGFLDFYLGHEQGSTALAGKVEHNPDIPQVDYRRAVKVPCVDLCAWIRRHINPGDELIIKMDIEGGEYEVVPQMIDQDILKMVKVFYCEWHISRFPGISRDFHDGLVAQVRHETLLEDWI